MERNGKEWKGMKQYLSENELSDIMLACQDEVNPLDENEALKRLNDLFKRASFHGTFYFKKGELSYKSSMQVLVENVQNTSSIIAMPQANVEPQSKIAKECGLLEVEQLVIQTMVDIFNRSFERYGKHEWAEIYFYRHIKNIGVRDFSKRLHKSNRVVYQMLELSEKSVIIGFCFYPVFKVYNDFKIYLDQFH